MQPDNFDKRIREVLSNKHFAYDPAGWEQANILLDQQKRRKRLLWWFWPIMGVLLLLAAVGAVQYSQHLAADAAVAIAKPPTSVNAITTNPQSSNATTETEQKSDVTPSGNSATTKAAQNDAFKNTSAILSMKKKHSYTNLQTTKTAAVAGGADRYAEPVAVYALLESRRPTVLKRSLFTSQMKAKEQPESAQSFERKAANTQSIALGLHAFGGTAFVAAEGAKQFNYGGGLFVEMRKNKMYLTLEPAVNFIQGVGGTSSRSDTAFQFGRIIKTQTLAWQDILLVQLPIVIGLEVYPKHTLAIGLVAQQYLQSRYTLSETTYQQGYPASATSVSGGQARIISLEIAKIHGLVRYQYQLSPAFSLGLQYNFLSSDEQYPVNSQVQFQLKYHLFNHQK